MDEYSGIEQVMMNIKRTDSSVTAAAIFTANVSLRLLVFLWRMAKKGLVASGLADNFKSFISKTDGNYTIYNIPLSAEHSEKAMKLNELGLRLQSEKNPAVKASIRNEMKRIQKEIPELEQINNLRINHCVLPKVNGSDSTIQVAVDKKGDQSFKNWFLNHLTMNMSGGKKSMEELKNFTEGNYRINNLPFEGEELAAALSDFDKLGINYAILPDLKVGDGYSQVAVPNADHDKLQMWFQMWKEKQMQEGKEPGMIYDMDKDSYMNTGAISQEEYIQTADEKYQAADAEFEAHANEVPWTVALRKENSEEYVRLLQDDNFEKITINGESLVEGMKKNAAAAQMQKKGYFISRVPGTYGDKQEMLILPRDQVFLADGGKTYIAFLPKNQNMMIADNSGNVTTRAFSDTYKAYDKVQRNMGKVEGIMKEAKVKPSPNKKQIVTAFPAPKQTLKV